jgi:hypothetical protein
MSLTSSAAPVAGPTTAAAAPGPRRVREQARDAVLLMAFSAASSVAVAAGFLLLAHLSGSGR